MTESLVNGALSMGMTSVGRGTRRLLLSLEGRPVVAGVVLAALLVTLFATLQRHPVINDSDAFYHAAMARRLARGELTTTFPWLPQTILATNFADHHLLYHAALVPFVATLDPLLGLKAAVVVFGVMAMLGYFWTLRRLAVVGALWWTLLTATSWPFLFRLNLVKALPLSLLLYLLGLVALRERRAGLLAALSFLYVWTYGGWPLLPFTVALFGVVTAIVSPGERRESLVLFVAALLGSLAGVTLNPYFPANLTFFWTQVFGIALTPTSLANVGNEWFAYPPLELYLHAAPLFLATLVVMVLSVVLWLTGQPLSFRHPGDRAFSLTLVVVAVLLFLMTLLSRRYVEYFVPVAFVAVSLWATALLRSPAATPFAALFTRGLRRRYFQSAAAICVVLIVLYSGRAVYRLERRFETGISPTYLRGTATWLAEHLAPGTLVFNLRWDDFPALFYFNDTVRYVIGLDLRFFVPPRTFRLEAWEALYDGTADDPARLVRETFGADYVVVSERSAAAGAVLERHGFAVLYRDAEATVYAVP